MIKTFWSSSRLSRMPNPNPYCGQSIDCDVSGNPGEKSVKWKQFFSMWELKNNHAFTHSSRFESERTSGPMRLGFPRDPYPTLRLPKVASPGLLGMTEPFTPSFLPFSLYHTFGSYHRSVCQFRIICNKTIAPPWTLILSMTVQLLVCLSQVGANFATIYSYSE